MTDKPKILGVLVLAVGVCAIPDTSATEQSAGKGGRPAGAPPASFRHAPPSQEELDRLLRTGFAATVRVSRVLVPAVVVDRRGRPVHGLKIKDFKLTEDRVPQRIDFFDVTPNEKVSIAFLLDVSGSMRMLDKMGEAREAIRFFLEGLGRGDQASLMIFADGEVQTIAPFGTRPDSIIARLEAIKAYGQTALHDAIAAAPAIVMDERVGRKAIILITDGMDNASRLTLYEAMKAARQVDVPIYAIGFPANAEAARKGSLAEATNEQVLKLIAMETGGNFFKVEDPDDLKEAIRSVEEDLRSQYLLGYTPPRAPCDGAYRRIDLKTKGGYRVRSRRGYVAGPC